VSISATEANNARYISGAQDAAKTIGWNVSVIDAAGNADQANAAIQNFAQRGAHDRSAIRGHRDEGWPPSGLG
jgi:ribose transport system substrate-binding protein